MAARVPARLSAAEGRTFGLTVGIAFLVFGALSLWRGHDRAPMVLFALGGALSVAGLAIPTRLGPVQRGWMGLAHAISRVTTPIAMGLVYFVAITPIGIVRRLTGSHPFHPRARPASLWVESSRGRGSMQRQF